MLKYPEKHLSSEGGLIFEKWLSEGFSIDSSSGLESGIFSYA